MAFPAENAGSSGAEVRAALRIHARATWRWRPAPGGKIVVAGATKIVRYLANGKLDPTFGTGGVVSVPRPPGAVFVLAGVAVDSYGRVVLAGLTRPLPTNSTPDPVLSSAAVMRFNANGSAGHHLRQRRHGDHRLRHRARRKPAGGTVPRRLGRPARRRHRLAEPSRRQRRLRDRNRHRTRRGVKSKGFVARLTESGALDPSFGEERPPLALGTIASDRPGLRRLPGGLPGAVLLGPEGPHQPARPGSTKTATSNSTFGSFGFRALPFGRSRRGDDRALRQDPPARPADSTAHLQQSQAEEQENGQESNKSRSGTTSGYQTVQRLLPSGAADPGFGRVGRINYTDPRPARSRPARSTARNGSTSSGGSASGSRKSPHNPLHRDPVPARAGQPEGHLRPHLRQAKASSDDRLRRPLRQLRHPGRCWTRRAGSWSAAASSRRNCRAAAASPSPGTCRGAEQERPGSGRSGADVLDGGACALDPASPSPPRRRARWHRPAEPSFGDGGRVATIGGLAWPSRATSTRRSTGDGDVYVLAEPPRVGFEVDGRSRCGATGRTAEARPRASARRRRPEPTDPAGGRTSGVGRPPRSTRNWPALPGRGPTGGTQAYGGPAPTATAAVDPTYGEGGEVDTDLGLAGAATAHGQSTERAEPPRSSSTRTDRRLIVGGSLVTTGSEATLWLHDRRTTPARRSSRV